MRARASTILVVEPHPPHLAQGADILSRRGYQVISASSLDDAMALVSRFDPHLLVLDGGLAEPHILEDLSRSSVRPLSVIFTFHQGRGAQLMSMLDLSEACPSVEVMGFVEKPFSADMLITTVEEGLGASASVDAIEEDKNPFEATQRIFAAREDVTQISQVISAMPLARENSGGALYRALGIDPPAEPSVERRGDSRVMEPELPRRNDQLDAEELANVSRAYRLAERIVAMMPERYPLHPAQMCAIASACEEAIREDSTTPAQRDPNAVMEGALSGVPAFQVLQLAENLGSAVLCRFTHAESAIEVWIRDRHVVWARDHNRFDETEQLVYEVLSWNEGRFAVLTHVVLPQPAEHSGVEIPLAALLLEGLSRLDEHKRVQSRPRVHSHA